MTNPQPSMAKMENDTASNIEFSLVDALLPLAEAWKMLFALPIIVAGFVFIFFHFYPANQTYAGSVHLPLEQIGTLLTEETLSQSLEPLVKAGGNIPAPSDLLAKLQMLSTKPDETRLSITLPRADPAAQILSAIVGILEPEAGKLLETQKKQTSDEIAMSERTIAALNTSAATFTAALETATEAGQSDIDAIDGPTQKLNGVANALWATRNALILAQNRVNELASATAIEPFRLESKSMLYVGLAGVGMLFLVLIYIYVRQEFLFALSHDSGRLKVAKIMQSLKISRGRKSTRP